MSEKIAYYPGSFDPFTNGHMDVLEAAMRIADTLYVAIGVHPSKTPMFSFEERSEMIREAARATNHGAEDKLIIVGFDGLVVDAARQVGAHILIRGVRDGTDLDYEMQMAGMNGMMAPALQTVFLPARPQNRPITATLVRQISQMNGDTAAFVPANVERALKRKSLKS